MTSTGSLGQKIIDYVADDFLKHNGVDLRKNDLALKRLTEAAQKAENDLFRKNAAEVSLPFIAANAKGPLHVKMRLTQEMLGG